MRVFEPVVEKARPSIVQFSQEGKAVSLGAIIDTSGLALTKASEIKPGPLLGKLATGQTVEAETISVDEDNDVALVQLRAACLKPLEWSQQESSVGQWLATPGLETMPETVGILSVPARQIPPKRALIGVILSPATDAAATILRVMPDLGADRAGLKTGDVLLAVNDEPVKNGEELTGRLRKFREGQKVRLRVRRDKKEFDADIPLTAEKSLFEGRSGNRQTVMNRLIGRVSRRAEDFESVLQHDSVLQPWQCGGPLLDLEGKAVGLNIARAGRTASYALPASVLFQTIQTLQNQPRTALDSERLPVSEEIRAD